MKKVVLELKVLDCTLCGIVIESVLSRTPGIASASVNEKIKQATIVFDQNMLTAEKVQEIILKLGYKTGLVEEKNA